MNVLTAEDLMPEASERTLPASDPRNLIDQYKGWEEDLIRRDLLETSFPYHVAMLQLQGDFNLGTVVRNANAFGARSVMYVGNRKWDRRGAVGTHNYTDVVHVPTWRDMHDIACLGGHDIVALENNVDAVSLTDFQWPEHCIILLGEEGCGIPENILAEVDHVVSIPQFGSVRSLNAGVASGIAMYDFTIKYQGK